MVTDCQVRKLMKLLNEEQTLSLASAKSGMDEKTARKYRCLGKVPSEVSKEHSWRTREDPFAEIWEEVRSKLDVNSGLQAKTLFKDLQRRHPGEYQDGQLRTLQRRVKQWRALEGPPKEVFFEQRHEPGELCPTLGAVEAVLQLSETPLLEDVHIDEVELSAYDHLLDSEEEVVPC